jgi:hypothetical protein
MRQEMNLRASASLGTKAVRAIHRMLRKTGFSVTPNLSYGSWVAVRLPDWCIIADAIVNELSRKLRLPMPFLSGRKKAPRRMAGGFLRGVQLL